MRISPSGSRKLVKLQQSKIDFPQFGIEQTDINPQDMEFMKKDYNPIGDLETQLQQQKAKNVITPQNKTLPDLSEKTDTDNKDADMEDAYFDLLKNLGITAKISDPAKKSQLFTINVDLMGGNAANGFFLIPEYVDSERINQNKAQQLAKDFASQFGVTKLTFQKEKYNYKFNFTIAPKQDASMTNSSLDSVLSGEKKSAEIKNGIIKESRNHIINSLVKKGFGGK